MIKDIVKYIGSSDVEPIEVDSDMAKSHRKVKSIVSFYLVLLTAIGLALYMILNKDSGIMIAIATLISWGWLTCIVFNYEEDEEES